MFIFLIPQNITKMLLVRLTEHLLLVPLVGGAMGQVGHLHVLCTEEGVFHGRVILGAVK